MQRRPTTIIPRLITGHTRTTNRNEDTYQRGQIWYASLILGEMTPVRMEFTTAFGVVKAYLAELRGHGVDLRLMRSE